LLYIARRQRLKKIELPASDGIEGMPILERIGHIGKGKKHTIQKHRQKTMTNEDYLD
jgi:hypothetical protein